MTEQTALVSFYEMRTAGNLYILVEFRIDWKTTTNIRKVLCIHLAHEKRNSVYPALPWAICPGTVWGSKSPL